MGKISKVLIANRGEIACRIIRTARAKGYVSVAVYSDADAQALHVLMADEAMHIGPSVVAESYLSAEKILAAAKACDADAIHPGYGFLSENAAFAEACAEAGIIFIGPSPESITLMGDKGAAKRRMKDAGVPCVPGYDDADADDKALKAEAKKLGYPVMIKAVAGGGGRGMRAVAKAKDFADALKSARSEARNAFGSGEVILEKVIVNPRHVEVQVFGDTHGNLIHLGERDCSVQRRHQKVIEESPCPVLTDSQRAAICQAAVDASNAIGYIGAGTIEFLLDESGDFYFLEMNTRLQVEHPVTEFVTGLDLVALQFEVAEGRPLPVTQDDVRFRGHAIEARLYAEDARNGFLPQTGALHLWQPPEGEGIRVDHGLASNTEVSPFYDPLLAKIIAYGSDREEARRRLCDAIRRTKALGVTTNKAFLYDALGNEVFAAGNATTAFVAETWEANEHAASPAWVSVLAGALLIEHSALAFPAEIRNWSSMGVMEIPVTLQGDDGTTALHIRINEGAYEATIGDEDVSIRITSFGECRAWFVVEETIEHVDFVISDDHIFLDLGAIAESFTDVTYAPPEEAGGSTDGMARAPMNGQIVLVSAAEGDKVSKGQVLVVVEAMKMENQVLAPRDGIVEKVSTKEGDQVDARQVLVTLKAED